MEIVRGDQSQKHSHQDTVAVYEYATAPTDLGGAVAEIKGRYPGKGFAVNRRVSQLVYVIAGYGAVIDMRGPHVLMIL